jgi:ATP:ADP antiporter, AAA family
MVKNRLSSIKEEIRGFTAKEKKFLFFAMVSIFCISFEYAVTRPASTSLFLHFYGANSFPLAWLITVPINFAAVSIYNYFLPRIGCCRIWIFISLLTACVNTFTFFFLDHFPYISFCQFIWKEIYVLLMFKQIWSLIHSSVTQSRAKYLYGLIFSLGGIGSACGGIIPGFFASFFGTKQLFLFTLPIYLLLCLLYLKAYKNSNFNFSLKKEEPIFPGFRHSKYIIYTLLIVVFMQLSIAIIEYKFNLSLERAIFDVDLRTEFAGKIMSIIHGIMILLQLIGGIVLINIFGFKNVHYFIPITLLINTVIFLFIPTLPVAAYLFIYVKSIDFSIFNIVREMLYLPMKIEEKFKAKALIDVFAYRTAKALGGFFVFFFEIFKNQSFLSFFALAVFIFWTFTVKNLFKTRYSYDLNSSNISN